jgi:FkbM family methyltransferase
VLGSALGASVRRLPRGRNRVATVLQSHSRRPVVARDGTGLLRTFELHDLLQAQWFCGVPVGLADDALRLLRPGAWVIDVGANIGIVTGQMCQAVGPLGLVTALEPLPANQHKLRRLKADNRLHQLDVRGVAAGAERARLSLRLPPRGNSGWASFSASWLGEGTVEVDVVTLDEVVAGTAGGRTVDLVKIDVEGYEFEVLEGARDLLARHRPVLVMEFNDPLLRDRGRSSLDLLEVCRSYGYDPIDAGTATAEWFEGAVRDVVLRCS